jgi:hypothetical protein
LEKAKHQDVKDNGGRSAPEAERGDLSGHFIFTAAEEARDQAGAADAEEVGRRRQQQRKQGCTIVMAAVWPGTFSSADKKRCRPGCK